MAKISKGDSNRWVVYLQTSLISLGYNIGPSKVDGNFGSGTESAVKQFQSDNNLTKDGIVGNNTWAKIMEKIRPIQEKLIEKGYFVGEGGADGIFGYNTINAVKEFQKDNNLKQDGIAGDETQKALFKNFDITDVAIKFLCDYKIINVQNALQTLCYDIGSSGADGVKGAKTKEAIKKFQKDNGLNQTGDIDLATNLKLKMKILEIQSKLLEKGFTIGDCGADGICGYYTIEAIKSFQKYWNLKVDGKVGPQTREKLFSERVYSLKEQVAYYLLYTYNYFTKPSFLDKSNNILKLFKFEEKLDYESQVLEFETSNFKVKAQAKSGEKISYSPSDNGYIFKGGVCINQTGFFINFQNIIEEKIKEITKKNIEGTYSIFKNKIGNAINTGKVKISMFLNTLKYEFEICEENNLSKTYGKLEIEITFKINFNDKLKKFVETVKNAVPFILKPLVQGLGELANIISSAISFIIGILYVVLPLALFLSIIVAI